LKTHLADGSKAVRDVREGRLEVKVAREAYVLLGEGDRVRNDLSLVKEN